MRTRYYFPSVNEDEHRSANNFSYWVALLVAILPFLINSIWGIYDGRAFAVTENEVQSTAKTEFFKRGVTDIAFAGVIIAVSTFTNTYFAYVRLIGWKRMSWPTFVSLLFVSVMALFNFVAYLQVTHLPPPQPLLDDIFYLTMLNVFSCSVMSYVAHYSLLSDEFRNAREFIATLPTNDIPPRLG